jgi:hypothetical protein
MKPNSSSPASSRRALPTLALALVRISMVPATPAARAIWAIAS